MFQFQGQANSQASLRTANLIGAKHKPTPCLPPSGPAQSTQKSLDVGITVGMFVLNTCLHFEMFPDEHM